MSRTFAATDFITIPQDFRTGNVLSFRMRTTQTTANVEILSHHTATASQGGYGVAMNAPNAGKLTVSGKTGFGNIFAFTMNSTIVVNDGNWHHIGINFWQGVSTNGQQLFVDGTLDVQASNTNTWGGATDPFRLGKSNDTFWAGYVGELAEVAVWGGSLGSLQFTPEQMQALAKGFAPDVVWRNELHIYPPLVRGVQCLVSELGTPTVSGTSVSDHPRVLGSRGP